MYRNEQDTNELKHKQVSIFETEKNTRICKISAAPNPKKEGKRM